MIIIPALFLKKVKEFNSFFDTDYKVIEIKNLKVPFCKIKATKYQMSDVFDLGCSLAELQYCRTVKGEISRWYTESVKHILKLNC